MATISPIEWDAYTSHFSNPHILQTTRWGQLKADFGWRPVHVVTHDCGAQILIKRILPGINFAYIPKGPIGSNWSQLWPEIDTICRDHHCAFLKIEPDCWVEADEKPNETVEQIQKFFIISPHSIQPVQTLVVNIIGEEPQILGRMKQKTRYNINLALKKNVAVKIQTDIQPFYDLMKMTGQRDQFGIHSLAYYQRAFELFSTGGQCALLVAEYEGSPISAFIIFQAGTRAWYFYGASSNLYRDRMPNYLLQWEAIRWAKSKGCLEYDLWGIPDADLNMLETQFASRSDGLWGVYRFKRGFGGELRRSIGAWDRVYSPMIYRLYSIWMRYRKDEG